MFAYLQGISDSLRLKQLYVYFGAHPGGAITKTFTLNVHEKRVNFTAQSGLRLVLEINLQSTMSGLSSVLDFRCINIRG